MKYLYRGPSSGVTLQRGTGKQEIVLNSNTEVELPEEHAYTQTLLALNHLIPIQSELFTTPSVTSPKKNTKRGV